MAFLRSLGVSASLARISTLSIVASSIFLLMLLFLPACLTAPACSYPGERDRRPGYCHSLKAASSAAPARFPVLRGAACRSGKRPHTVSVLPLSYPAFPSSPAASQHHGFSGRRW